MIVGIHQPHYFPWMGYFDKMAKSDMFILLDVVQLEKGSYMYRNRILNAQGKITYLTISGDKHGFLNRSYKEIASTNDEEFLEKQRNEIERSYGESQYFGEVWTEVKSLFERHEHTICGYCIRSIERVKQLLEIPTVLKLQSDLSGDLSKRKNDLVLNLCQTVGATRYLSGNGARNYTDESTFENAGIQLRYQKYTSPVYNQLHTKEFISGLSILDMLFNCGIENTKKLFWKGVNEGTEFDDK